MRAFALALLGALVLLGVTVVVRSHVWSPGDERGHYSVVQTVAEEQRLPRITELNSPEAQAISDGTWPRPSPTDPRTLGLGGRNYEAFQPPLYYVVAAPVFAAVPDHRDKLFALRALDLALVLGAALVLWLLAGRRPLVWAAGALVLLWPGTLVRGITISNSALEYVLAPAFLLAAWAAYETRARRWLLAAGALLGLCLLTKLTLVVLAPCLLAAAWRARDRSAVAALALPALLLAPWLLSNHSRFGTWTANAAARRQQIPFLYPDGVPDWSVADLPGKFAELLKGSLPQEWAGQLDIWWVGIGARALVVVLAVAVLVAVVRGSARARFFALPVATGLVVMTATLLVSDWDIFLLRYLAPVLPAVAVVVAGEAAPRLVRRVAVPAAVVGGLLWLGMAGAFLFTDAGAKLGIRAVGG